MNNYPFGTIYDVVIVGGGLSGLGCALSLKKKVLILERRTSLGWEITSSFFPWFEGRLSSDKSTLKNELESKNGIRNNRVSPAIFEISIESVLQKMNVDVILYTYPIDVIRKDDLIAGLIVGNKNGIGLIRSKVFVDATENLFLLKKSFNQNLEWNPDFSYIYYIYFNGVEKEIKEPEPLNIDMKGIKVLSLGPGFRKGELFVEIQTEKTGITDTRIKFPEVIAFLRDRFEFLKESLVSHISQEPLVIKTKSPQSFSNPIKNLFPAIFFNTEKPDTTLLDLRLEAGIRIGKHLKRSNRCFPDDIERFDCEKYPGCDEEFDFDVVVTGGGTAGAVAAIASAREGAKTAVVEHSTCLGGLGTGGGVHHYYLGLGGGIQKEIEERSTELTNLFRGKFNISGWHPEAKKIVLEEMCSAAGAKIFYQNCFVDAEMKNSRISAIHCVTPCGKIKYSAQVFVDATGDADVAVKAGTPYTLGRNRDRIPQPFTLVPMKLIPDGSLIHINFDSGFVDPTDVVDLSKAKRESLRLFERRIKNEVDIPLYICPILGIRQGRQILGKYTLTLMDEILGTRFPDSISSMSSHYDNHSKDMENQSYHALIWRWLTDNHLTRLECEIPYRCLLPLNVEGLLVTGRAISLEPEAHYALRMEKDMERIGEVAGIAASICVKKGLFPSNIDIAELQEKLKKSGCWDPEYNVKPAIDLKKPQHVLKQKFFNKDFKEPVSLWAFFLSKETENFLNSALRSKASDNEVKFWSAVILAIHGKKQGLRTLLNYLGTKRNINSPLYISLIVILGKLKEKEALHFLHDIIFDKTAGVDTIIAAIRAIGEIGSKKSIKTIEKFIKRKEKPHTRILSEGRKGFIKRVQEDILWQIELACAETLKTLGKPYKEIVAKYLNDPRKYVRNYAETIC